MLNSIQTTLFMVLITMVIILYEYIISSTKVCAFYLCIHSLTCCPLILFLLHFLDSSKSWYNYRDLPEGNRTCQCHPCLIARFFCCFENYNKEKCYSFRYLWFNKLHGSIYFIYLGVFLPTLQSAINNEEKNP